MRLAAIAVLAGVFAALSDLALAQEKRVALVIANAKYAHVPTLANPGNNGRDVAAALKRLIAVEASPTAVSLWQSLAASEVA